MKKQQNNISALLLFSSLFLIFSHTFSQKEKESFVTRPQKREEIKNKAQENPKKVPEENIQEIKIEKEPENTPLELKSLDTETNETFINTNALLDNLHEQVVELTPEVLIQDYLKREPKPKELNSLKKDKDLPLPEDRGGHFQDINGIVLDAGHGGKDSGTEDRRGINGLKEKWLVMALVKKLHAKFRKERPDFKVYVTRKNDTFIPLEERVSKTAKWSAPKENNLLFISIHGNSALSPRPEGFEIYTLSDRASDPEALEVERLENAGFTKEDVDRTQSVFSLLADLLRDGTRKQSEYLARFVYQKSLKEIGSMSGVGRGLRRANFFVLKYNTVPSILVEVGYISNPTEVRRLKDPDYHDLLVNGIFDGTTQFIDEYNLTKGFTVKGK